MDALAPEPDTAVSPQDASFASGERLSAYARARRQRDRRRRIIRGAIGIGFVPVAWQIIAVAYDLQQILPPPLTVLVTIYHTPTLTYQQRWLCGPNIYEQLAASLVRAISGFTVASALAIPLGLL